MTKLQKEKIERWAQGCEILPCMVVGHLVSKGYEMFRSKDFLKNLNKVVEDYQIKEKEAEKRGSVLFITSDYIRSVNMECYKLVNENDYQFVYDCIKKYL